MMEKSCAPCEDRTHDLQIALSVDMIMRLTRCLLR